MKQRIFLLIALKILSLNTYSQFNIKKFKEGYIIRGDDTAKCKIFTGSSVNRYEQVVFRYTDSKFEDPINYFAGSIVKGYGIKTDSAYIHFFAFPKSKHSLFKKSQETVYGRVEVGGYLKLLEYTQSTYSPGAMRPGGGFSSGTTSSATSFYLYKTGGDSAYNIRGENATFLSGIDEETIINYFSDYPELVEKMKTKTKIKFKDIIEYVKEYNTWYEDNKNRK